MSGIVEPHAVYKRKFSEILQNEQFTYQSQLSDLLSSSSPSSPTSVTKPSKTSSTQQKPTIQTSYRIKVSLNDIRSIDATLITSIIHHPRVCIVAFESALNDLSHELDTTTSTYLSEKGIKLRVGFYGTFGANHVTPRGLTSNLLRQLVCVEGIVTKVSVVRPKIVKSSHFCPNTGETTTMVYRDNTDIEVGLPVIDSSGIEASDRLNGITTSVYPTTDKDKNRLEFEYGLSEFKDTQTVTIQEMPESAPVGQLPRSIDVLLSYDLVDTVKPGDRVASCGIFMALSQTGINGTVSGTFKTVVVGNTVRVLGRDTKKLELNIDDIRNIKSIAKRPDVLDVLGRSVAPSIYGHTYIKKALALQMLGGCEKNLINGTHIRGDINLLMVGDPSTAKSQLLRSALMIAPLAISTTGRGSSGVGLTAAVTTDAETGDRRLEAGAMVLADRGLVCIDEFDKMSTSDRVSIHEVMEQQTVTIAKAGIHASLNARCSVLAAANPVWGQYDKTKRAQENIGLPDSLLSRFDLLFIVLDQLDAGNDRKISQHVLRGHMYRRQGTDMEPEPLMTVGEDEDEDEDVEIGEVVKTKVWVKSHHDNGDAGNSASAGLDHADDVLSQEFLRKYIYYAKLHMKPVLSEDAREYIANRYAEMRAKQDDKTLPVTARSLETIIRLGSAVAKARLSGTVERGDCEGAMDVMGFAMYHEEVAVKQANVKGHEMDVEGENTGENKEDGEEKNEDEDETNTKRRRLDLNNNTNTPDNNEPQETPEQSFTRRLTMILRTSGEVGVGEAIEELGVDSVQAEAWIKRLGGENKVYVNDDVIYEI